jgi:predicted PurR-regulated permease PerM
MTLSLNKLLQWLIVALLFPLVILNGWLAFKVFQYFQPLVTIFVLAALLAFLMDFPVQFLQQRGVDRKYAILLIFLPTLVILVALSIILVPTVLEQFNEVTKVLPNWIDSTRQKLQIVDNWAMTRGLPVHLSEWVTQLADRLPNEFDHLADHILRIALDTIDSLSEALLTVVLAFYLLIDGERLWDGLFQRLPSRFSLQVKQSLQQNFQNYFIGQIALATLVGFSMTSVFLLLKVRFGLLFGLVIGLVSVIPFGDVLSLGTIGLLIASHDFWLAVKVLAVAIVVDQIIDQAIAPRLLGSFTGLRPVWVLISLAVGTYVGGLLGLVIAVPLAGFINSLIDGWQDDTESDSNNGVKLVAPDSNSSNEDQESPEIFAKESTSAET